MKPQDRAEPATHSVKRDSREDHVEGIGTLIRAGGRDIVRPPHFASPKVCGYGVPSRLIQI